ncbi:mechanosensitive ion channel family protein [Microlunatus ginsengisoli]|uniref:Small conductance mechanosensitive channel n=1 Tax=Microlunatus ginsengisoli TaxID=363863 RepID=A0ABP6ZI66_9ACTN
MPSWLPSNLAEVPTWPPVHILLLLLIAVAVRFISHRLIDRSVERSIAKPVRWRPAQALESASGLPAQRRSQRIRALGSLAKSLITVTVLLVTLVMVLSELGFNVTAIVAGTSLVAAAVAFGTQSIVKDLLSGIFLLVEDQLGVGDYVDMQLATGTVEEIGLRVTQLRADDGTVWYVRNGEVLRLANLSKGGPDRPAPAVQNVAVRMVPPEPPAPADPADGDPEAEDAAGDVSRA